MSTDSSKNYCQVCGRELELIQRPCPFCGGNGIAFERSMSDTVGITDNMRFKQRRKGVKRPIREGKSGHFPSVDSEKHPNGVEKTQMFDREKDEYHETVVDKKAGEVTRDVHEPLSEHRSKRDGTN